MRKAGVNTTIRHSNSRVGKLTHEVRLINQAATINHY